MCRNFGRLPSEYLEIRPAHVASHVDMILSHRLVMFDRAERLRDHKLLSGELDELEIEDDPLPPSPPPPSKKMMDWMDREPPKSWDLLRDP